MNEEIKVSKITNGRDIGRTARLVRLDLDWMIKIDKGEHRMSADKKRYYKSEKQARRQFEILTALHDQFIAGQFVS